MTFQRSPGHIFLLSGAPFHPLETIRWICGTWFLTFPCTTIGKYRCTSSEICIQSFWWGNMSTILTCWVSREMVGGCPNTDQILWIEIPIYRYLHPCPSTKGRHPSCTWHGFPDIGGIFYSRWDGLLKHDHYWPESTLFLFWVTTTSFWWWMYIYWWG